MQNFCKKHSRLSFFYLAMICGFYEFINNSKRFLWVSISGYYLQGLITVSVTLFLGHVFLFAKSRAGPGLRAVTWRQHWCATMPFRAKMQISGPSLVQNRPIIGLCTFQGPLAGSQLRQRNWKALYIQIWRHIGPWF